jgi:hypothetical protein
VVWGPWLPSPQIVVTATMPWEQVQGAESFVHHGDTTVDPLQIGSTQASVQATGGSDAAFESPNSMPGLAVPWTATMLQDFSFFTMSVTYSVAYNRAIIDCSPTLNSYPTPDDNAVGVLGDIQMHGGTDTFVAWQTGSMDWTPLVDFGATFGLRLRQTPYVNASSFFWDPYDDTGRFAELTAADVVDIPPYPAADFSIWCQPAFDYSAISESDLVTVFSGLDEAGGSWALNSITLQAVVQPPDYRQWLDLVPNLSGGIQQPVVHFITTRRRLG